MKLDLTRYAPRLTDYCATLPTEGHRAFARWANEKIAKNARSGRNTTTAYLNKTADRFGIAQREGWRIWWTMCDIMADVDAARADR